MVPFRISSCMVTCKIVHGLSQYLAVFASSEPGTQRHGISAYSVRLGRHR